MRIFLDPGHGGHDSGAQGPDGTREKDLVLSYAQNVRVRLAAAGHDVKMSREDDTFVPLSSRARAADTWGADCLVSIHANAASAGAANGAWVIYDDKTDPGKGKALARAIFDAMEAVPDIADEDPAEEVYPDGTGWVGHRQLTVISATRCPAVLVELGFLTNAGDLSQLLDPVEHAKVAEAIRQGITAWGVGRGLVDLPPRPAPGTVDSVVDAPLPDLLVAPWEQVRAPEGDTFGSVITRTLRRLVDDPWAQDHLPALARMALDYAVDKLEGLTT